ncbi:hypothetical protein [Candidatus Nitrosotenuis cloacae]|uniref:Uncharacterized protein n=1 Tax=Candidatus Nitrosotenuis cloacae TaxID=1603555 RepID=A0A3G1B3X3_9ARCH|nr:hypothetical protein [Candidatus Nitrosotenuis cloacae]AJZ75436.1 hypothetical protein SU86_002460 [Candidatus Nitrosotenuis cloacae]
MNIYDTKQIHCSNCDAPIGEVAYDAEIISPRCGICVELLPKHADKLPSINDLPNDEPLTILSV